jgi:tetratricopeptide (TPR) repeat protein
MKLTGLAVFILVSNLLPASILHAQDGPRRRPVMSQSPVNAGVPWVDAKDPAATLAPPGSVMDPAVSHPGITVPVSQLRIPSKAVKEYERSLKSFQAGDLRASAEHLEKALQIYPDFFQAHNLLGARYVNLGRYEEGLAEYRRALAIDPGPGETYHNLAVALFFVKRYQDAEEAARRALGLLPQEVAVRYVLGRILVQQGKIGPESLQLLRQSEDEFPNASLVLAEIFFHQGNLDATANALRAYLRAPESGNKQKAECWLAQLTNQPSANCLAFTTPPAFQ